MASDLRVETLALPWVRRAEGDRRAQKQGSLRPDVTAEDLGFVFWANAVYLEATKGIAPDGWRRYVALLLQAFHAGGAQPLPQPPLTERQLFRAMARLRPAGRPPGRSSKRNW